MGCCKARVLSEVYRVGMEPDTYFDLRIYDSHRIMFHSINSACSLSRAHLSSYANRCCACAVTKEQARKAFRTFVKIDDECVGWQCPSE